MRICQISDTSIIPFRCDTVAPSQLWPEEVEYYTYAQRKQLFSRSSYLHDLLDRRRMRRLNKLNKQKQKVTHPPRRHELVTSMQNITIDTTTEIRHDNKGPSEGNIEPHHSRVSDVASEDEVGVLIVKLSISFSRLQYIRLLTH